MIYIREHGFLNLNPGFRSLLSVSCSGGISQRMSRILQLLTLTAIISSMEGQRPFYAGSVRPSESFTTTSNPSRTTEDDNCFPPELNCDKEYAERLKKLPVDKQPFWFVNRYQYQNLRDHPQNWPQPPPGFNNGK